MGRKPKYPNHPLRQWMSANDMPIADICRKLGVSRDWFYALLNGNGKPTLCMVYMLSDLTHKEASEVLRWWKPEL